MGIISSAHRRRKYAPKKILPTAVLPVSRSASQPLYVSKLANRIAIFGTMPESTAPRPLYSASGVSRRIIMAPVARKPRGLVYTRKKSRPTMGTTHHGKKTRTPGARPDLESCMRTLIVSNGWQHSCRVVRVRKNGFNCV